LLANPAVVDPIGTLRVADAAGNTISLDAPGVLYLVDVWALECKPCMQEMPELDRLAAEYETSGRFRLVSVVYGWRGAKLREVAEEAKTIRPVYSDTEQWLDRLGINAYPTKLLIRDGKLLRRTIGGGPGAYEKWKKLLDDELKTTQGASDH
jgi:thiol-disulfide isomerase/thioredoxin